GAGTTRTSGAAAAAPARGAAAAARRTPPTARACRARAGAVPRRRAAGAAACVPTGAFPRRAGRAARRARGRRRARLQRTRRRASAARARASVGEHVQNRVRTARARLPPRAAAGDRAASHPRADPTPERLREKPQVAARETPIARASAFATMDAVKLKPLSSATDVAALCLVLLAVGGVLRLTVSSASADAAWGGAVALLLPALGWSVVKSLLERDLGVDAIALVSMVGALALGQYLAGAVIALMLAGGNALEERAGVRARRELTLLVSRAPHTARVERDGQLVETPVDDVVPGDLVVVRSGEVLPVDGVVESGEAVLDESALTGESLPVVRRRGHVVRSGAVSTTALRLRATRSAAESAYASLVRLVRQAETQRAPFVRMADRYAAFFLPLTTAVAAIAWVTSGDPVRALAVFVVATPCPLILAAPIALLSGVSRAARAGIVVKGAGVIERLGSA